MILLGSYKIVSCSRSREDSIPFMILGIHDSNSFDLLDHYQVLHLSITMIVQEV